MFAAQALHWMCRHVCDIHNMHTGEPPHRDASAARELAGYATAAAGAATALRHTHSPHLRSAASALGTAAGLALLGPRCPVDPQRLPCAEDRAHVCPTWRQQQQLLLRLQHWHRRRTASVQAVHAHPLMLIHLQLTCSAAAPTLPRPRTDTSISAARGLIATTRSYHARTAAPQQQRPRAAAEPGWPVLGKAAWVVKSVGATDPVTPYFEKHASDFVNINRGPLGGWIVATRDREAVTAILNSEDFEPAWPGARLCCSLTYVHALVSEA